MGQAGLGATSLLVVLQEHCRQGHGSALLALHSACSGQPLYTAIKIVYTSTLVTAARVWALGRGGG